MSNVFILTWGGKKSQRQLVEDITSWYINTKLPRYKNLNIEIDIKSIRDDSSVGVHEVKFSLDNDEIIFTHNAVNRKIFAQGAVKAIEWIITQKPGFYSMQEISF